MGTARHTSTKELCQHHLGPLQKRTKQDKFSEQLRALTVSIVRISPSTWSELFDFKLRTAIFRHDVTGPDSGPLFCVLHQDRLFYFGKLHSNSSSIDFFCSSCNRMTSSSPQHLIYIYIYIHIRTSVLEDQLPKWEFQYCTTPRISFMIDPILGNHTSLTVSLVHLSCWLCDTCPS